MFNSKTHRFYSGFQMKNKHNFPVDQRLIGLNLSMKMIAWKPEIILHLPL